MIVYKISTEVSAERECVCVCVCVCDHKLAMNLQELASLATSMIE